MLLSSEVQDFPIGAALIVVGVLAVSLGVALVLSVGCGLIVGGALALALGVDACRDVVPMRPSLEDRGELRAVGEVA